MHALTYISVYLKKFTCHFIRSYQNTAYHTHMGPGQRGNSMADQLRGITKFPMYCILFNVINVIYLFFVRFIHLIRNLLYFFTY